MITHSTAERLDAIHRELADIADSERRGGHRSVADRVAGASTILKMAALDLHYEIADRPAKR